jgi:hypothetical protein
MTSILGGAALSTLYVPKAISEAEAELFSPMARRPYDLERRFTAHALPLIPSRSALEIRRDAEYDSQGSTPFEAMSPMPVAPTLDATTPMTIPAVTITPAPTSLIIQGPCLKRSRWNAWQPRWASLTEDGELVIAHSEGGEPSLRLATSTLTFALTPGDGSGAPAAEMTIVARPSGKKLKISAPEDALVSWAQALGGQGAVGSRHGPAPAA